MIADLFSGRGDGAWFVRLSIGASALLVIFWVLYLVYLLTTLVDKQSVYVGSITFWTAALLLTCGAVAVFDLVCLGVAWMKQATGRRLAATTFVGAFLLVLLMYFASGKLVDLRMVA